MKINVGLAQISPVLGDVEANMSIHLDTIRQARTSGIGLLIFPELSLTGYKLGEKTFDLAIRATADDPVFGRLLAASEGIDLVVSFVERDERYRYYICAAYLSGGRLIHRHRKVYLPTYGMWEEGKLFAHGDTVRAFDTRFGRIGLLICEDLWHTSLPWLLWQDGADILILISASLNRGEHEGRRTADKVVALNRAYALLFTSFVIHVNRSGVEGGDRYWGGSTIFGPDMSLLAEGPREAPAIVRATIDTDDLRAARIDLPLLRDERTDLVARELARILERNSRLDTPDSPPHE